MRSGWRASVAALVLAAAAAVPAQDEAARAQVQQRISLGTSLIGDATTAQRIAASGRREAIDQMDKGRAQHAKAQELLARGDLAGAREAADEALRLVGQARRLVPNTPARQAAARQRYEQMYAALDRLMDAWHRRGGSAIGSDGDHVHAMELYDTAHQFAREGRYEEAVHTLGLSERHVLAGMNRLLHATTLDYTARAETPAQELELEMSRHRSLVDLVPLALRDMRPPADAVTLIERYQDAAQTLHAQAQQSAKRGDVTQALAQIRNATLFVQRALGAAGVVTPQPTGTPQ